MKATQRREHSWVKAVTKFAWPYVAKEPEKVVLLTIYDKKDKADLEPGELDDLLNGLSEV